MLETIILNNFYSLKKEQESH